MYIKNINTVGPSGNPKPIPIIHLIPPVAEADFKVIIETASGNIDLYDLIVSGSYTDGCTTTIGDFEFKIIDPDRAIYNAISTYDEIVLYADYGTPTTARFRGIIERRGYLDAYTTISGRSIAMIFAEKQIIYSSNGERARSEVLKEIIADNFPNVTVTGIVSDLTGVNVNYSEIPFTQIIEEICGNHHDFYLDCNFDVKYFEKGSVDNGTEAISEDSNHIETTDNADDTETVYSKVRVYGKDYSGIPVLSTSVIDTTNTAGINKELKLTNTSLVNTAQADDYVNAQAESRRNIPRVGSITSFYLPSLLPGERLYIAIPREEISPDYYEVVSFKHSIDLNGSPYIKTTVTLKKQRINLSTIVKSRVAFENTSTDNPNENDLDFSKIITFESDIGTHDGTEISENYLKVTQGQSTGTWESPIYQFTDDVTQLYFKWNGDNLVGQYQVTSSQLWFSLNGGTSWHLVQPTITNIPVGRDLRLKVVLNQDTAQVNVIGILYSY